MPQDAGKQRLEDLERTIERFSSLFVDLTDSMLSSEAVRKDSTTLQHVLNAVSQTGCRTYT